MTMSEYILEQSISTATCFDIELERSLAEMNVLAEMCRCYEKAEMFSEYASDSSVVAECGIFLEADEATENSEEKKTGVVKRFLESAKTVLSNIWQKLSEVVEKLFTNPIEKALKNIPDGTIIIPKDSDKHYFIIGYCKMFDDLITKSMESFIESIKNNDIAEIKKNFVDVKTSTILNDIGYNSIMESDDSIEITKEFMIECLEKLKKSNFYKKKKNIMNEINSIVNIKENFEKDDVKTIDTAVKNLTRIANRCIKSLTILYDGSIIAYKVSNRKNKNK